MILHWRIRTGSDR